MNGMKFKYRGSFLRLIGLVLAFVLAVGTIAVFAEETGESTQTPDTIDVVLFAKDVARGTRLTEEHVKVVSMKNVNVPKNVISDTSKVISMFVTEDVYEGEYATSVQLSSKAVSKANSDLVKKEIKESKDDYVIVTDYVSPNTGENLSVFLQQIIDNNPNRCIYFPAGEYVISEPLNTSSVPNESVSLLLDDGAVIKAADNWKGNGDNALICFGASASANDIKSVGSYYSIMGGTLDANGKASGVAITSGREIVVRNICIKNAKIGISTPRGTNNTSSDCDFEDIVIIGQGKSGTVGIYDGACDNSFTNIRIYDMATGVDGSKGGEMKSIYVINTEKSAKIADTTVGFTKGGPRMTLCYTENCAIGFSMGTSAILNDCTSVWTSDMCKKQQMFAKSSGYTMASGCRAEYYTGEGITTAFIKETADTNKGLMAMEGCIFNVEDVDDDTYTKYPSTGIVTTSK